MRYIEEILNDIFDLEGEKSATLQSKRLSEEQKARVITKIDEYLIPLYEERKTYWKRQTLLGRSLKRITANLQMEILKRRGMVFPTYQEADLWLFWTYPEGIPLGDISNTKYVFRGS